MTRRSRGVKKPSDVVPGSIWLLKHEHNNTDRTIIHKVVSVDNVGKNFGVVKFRVSFKSLTAESNHTKHCLYEEFFNYHEEVDEDTYGLFVISRLDLGTCKK